MCYSPANNQIVCGSHDNSIKIWDIKSGKNIKSLGGHINVVSYVHLSQDGKKIISGSFDWTIRIWNL